MNIRIFISCFEEQRLNRIATSHFFSKFLKFGSIEKIQGNLEVEICKLLKVKRQLDWPLAAISRLGECGTVDEYYWFKINPVNLVLQRDCFSLGNLISLSPDEARSIVETLNHHFNEDGLYFDTSSGNQFFYLFTKNRPDILTSPPQGLLGKNTTPHLPSGSESVKWHGFMNEMQMLLHNHQINETRERLGQPIVNSLWLYGGGGMPELGKLENQFLYGDSFFSRGISRLSPGEVLPVPSSFSELMRLNKDEAVFLYEDDVPDLDTQLFSEIWVAMKRFKIKKIDLTIFNGVDLLNLSIRSTDLFKFWKKKQSLDSLTGLTLHG